MQSTPEEGRMLMPLRGGTDRARTETAETGTPVTEVCRAMEVTEQTHYRWN
jgi:hypothetical protein